MNAITSPPPVEQIILDALKKGDKNRGQLFDLTGKSYPLLVRALQQLQAQSQIETYFVPTGEISVLTYRLRAQN